MKKLLSFFVLLALLAGCAPPTPALPSPAIPKATSTTLAPPTEIPTQAAATLYPTMQPTLVVIPLDALPPGFRTQEMVLDRPPIAEDFDHDEVWAFYKEELLSVVEDRSFKAHEERRLKDTNAALAAFGYRLEQKPLNGFNNAFYLYRGDELALDGWIHFFSPVSVRGDGTDFTLMLDSSTGYQLLEKGGLTNLGSPYTRFPPQYIGDALLLVETDGFNSVRVLRDGQEIYSQAMEGGGASDPLRLFMVSGEHWVLETLDSIVVDGQPLNEAKGYQASFGYTELAGQAVYFFRRDSKIGLSLNGKELELGVDDVPHDACCSGAMLNPRATDRWLGFFAKKGDAWSYFEVLAEE